MSVMLMDHGAEFDPDTIHRFADAGCRQFLLFDHWWKHEPSRGQFVFEPIVGLEKGIGKRCQAPLQGPRMHLLGDMPPLAGRMHESGRTKKEHKERLAGVQGRQ